jgi:hypothetical protein
MEKELLIEVCPAENKPVDKRLSQLNYKNLPKLPATIMVLGRCGSGKSSILYSLLNKGFTYGKKKKSIFDEGICYIGTLDSKHAFENLPIKNMLVLDEFDSEDFTEYLDSLKKHQMEKLERNKSPMNTLIVFDDFCGANLIKRHGAKGSVLERLALTSRHETNTTLCYASQAYKNSGFANSTIRPNITTFILAQMSLPELEKFAEENSQDLTKDEFIAVYNRVMAKRPYNFLVIDMRRPLNARITERFTIPIPRPARLQELDKLTSVE